MATSYLVLRDDLLVAVGDVPALRKLNGKAQRRMQEHVATHDTGFRIVPEDDAVDSREIAVAIDLPRSALQDRRRRAAQL